MNAEPISNLVSNKTKALCALFSKQNHDGSWGNSELEKIRWTSNAVITLSLLKFDIYQSKQLKKAYTFLLNFDRSKKEWYLKVPALLKCCGPDKDILNEDIKALKSAIKNDEVGSLHEKASLVMELLNAGIIDIDLKIIREQILRTKTNHGSITSLGEQTHNAALYANFLSLLGEPDDNKIIEDTIKWIFLRKIVNKDTSSICWENSYGKTAYVCINVMNCQIKMDPVDQSITNAMNYFQLKHGGFVPMDKKPAHESTSPIYTTILYLRTLGTFFIKNSHIYHDAYRFLLIMYVLQRMRFHWLNFLIRMSPMIYILLGISLLILISYFFGLDLAKGIISSILAALGISGYVVFKRFFS
jgi:hypothetical protein